METTKSISKGVLWTSYILQGLMVAMFSIGAFNNIFKTEMAVNGAIEMGYPSDAMFYLGILLLLAIILYAIPKTTFIGGLILTAWLGGAVATHIIHHDPISMTIAPVIFGILIWFSVWLRSEKLKAIVLQ